MILKNLPTSILFLAVFAAALAAALPLPVLADADDAALRQRLNEHLKTASQADVSLGIVVIDVDSGDILFQHKPAAPLVPASNMKLATTAAALLELGPDFKFRTVIGTLDDDLVIFGGGDPNLSGRFYHDDPAAPFRQWATVLKNRGITHVKGDLVIDDSLFNNQWLHPRWPQKQYQHWYMAPVGALAANDSCIDVTISPAADAGDDGRPARVTLAPSTSYFHLRGEITTRRGKTNNPTLYRPRNSRTLRVGGTVPLASRPQTYNRTVDDPGLFAATVIADTLRSEGITIGGNIVRRKVYSDSWTFPANFKTQLIHLSPLTVSVNVCNTRSQNFYAECIIKLLGALADAGDGPAAAGIKRQGSWTSGAKQVERILRQAEIDTDGCIFDDGGGLSDGNRLTARATVQILKIMAKSDHWPAWRDSLAQPGDPRGTLRNWSNDALAGRVFAKTGFLNTSRCLSGYIIHEDGRRLAFSILANMPYRSSSHAAVKKLQENFLLELIQ